MTFSRQPARAGQCAVGSQSQRRSRAARQWMKAAVCALAAALFSDWKREPCMRNEPSVTPD